MIKFIIGLALIDICIAIMIAILYIIDTFGIENVVFITIVFAIAYFLGYKIVR